MPFYKQMIILSRVFQILEMKSKKKLLRKNELCLFIFNLYPPWLNEFGALSRSFHVFSRGVVLN